MIVGRVIAGSFMHSVVFEKLTFALVMQFVLLQVRIVVRVVALTPLMLSILVAELEIAQFLNVYVEVHRSLLFLARVSLLPRERTANLMWYLHS